MNLSNRVASNAIKAVMSLFHAVPPSYGCLSSRLLSG